MGSTQRPGLRLIETSDAEKNIASPPPSYKVGVWLGPSEVWAQGQTSEFLKSFLLLNPPLLLPLIADEC